MNATELVLRSPQPDTMLTVIERAVMSPDFDVNKLKELLELRERYEAAEARKAFVSAMNAFKQHPPVILKDKTAQIRSRKGEGSSFSYQYAPLDTVCRAVVSGLSAHGISHHWTIDDSQPDLIKVTCVLTHELGHSEEITMRGGVEKSEFINPMQCRAVTLSYLERYTLLAATGLAPTDDNDGHVTNGELSERVEWLHNASTVAELKSMFEDAYKAFKGNGNAQRALIAAKDQRKKVLEGM